MKLTKRAVAWLHRESVTLSDPVIQWEVQPHSDKRILILGFNVGRTDQEYWEITGRKGQYNSADEALAILQQEMPEDHMVWV